MASSFVISNPEATINSITSSLRKRRKIDTNNNQFQNQNNNFQTDLTRWRSESEHKIYATKLVDALRRRTSNSPSTSVRETADRILAVAAKGRTRWSRAILTNRLRLQMKFSKNRKVKKVITGDHRLKKSMKLLPSEKKKKKRMPAVEEKARDLSRLVPGCRKISFPELLEETTDYITALEMQVRAMSALTALLSTTASAES